MLWNKLLGATARPQLEISYINTYTSNQNTSTYTFTGCDLGTESPDRLILVAITSTVLSGSSDTLINGVTIGGNSASEVVYTGRGTNVCAIYQLVVSSGSSATIVVSMGGNTPGRCGISVFSIKNYLSSTPVGTDTDRSTATSRTVTVTTQPEGVAVVIASTGSAADKGTLSNMTEVVDIDIENANVHLAGINSNTPATSFSCTVTPDASTSLATCIASWK